MLFGKKSQEAFAAQSVMFQLMTVVLSTYLLRPIIPTKINQAHSQGVHPPPSDKRSTFSHKWAKMGCL